MHKLQPQRSSLTCSTSMLGSNMIRGTYLDGKTSAHKTVEVHFGPETMRILGLEETLEVPLRSVDVSESLGDTHRSILLGDGARIDVPNSPELDQIGGRHGVFSLVDALERRWAYSALAVVFVIGVCWAIVTISIPIAAKHLAAAIPVKLDEAIGTNGLKLLDRFHFEPTGLAEQEQTAILERFRPIVQYAQSDHQFRLEFRSGRRVGANAFALPSGIIVITDQLVELSANHEELDGVLGHEVGHIVNRHSLRRLLQSSATAMLLATFTGDLASLSSLAASIPTVLVQTGYSRDFEREADRYAYEYLEFANIPARRFTDILQRLEASHGGGVEGPLGYLSTHPPSSERVEHRSN